MEDEILTILTKSFNRHLVAETNKYPSLFKYCSFVRGFQMLRAMNLQFTRADGLNDEFEVNLSKTNIETHLSSLRNIGIPNDMISDKLQDSIQFFSGIGTCSLGRQLIMTPYGNVIPLLMVYKMVYALSWIKIKSLNICFQRIFKK